MNSHNDLFVAISENDLEKIIELVNSGYSLTGLDTFTKISVTQYTALVGDFELLQVLVKLGAPLTIAENKNPDFDHGILYHACQCLDQTQKKPILKWLKDNFENYKLHNDGLTIAHINAALGENVTEDEKLKSTPDQFGLYPYHYAALSGLGDYRDWISKDLEHYESITGKGVFDGIDLHWLIARGVGFSSHQKNLLRKKVDLNCRPLSKNHVDFGVTTAQLLFATKVDQHGVDFLKKYLELHPDISLDLLYTPANENALWISFPLYMFLDDKQYDFMTAYLRTHPEIKLNLNMKDEYQRLIESDDMTLGWYLALQGSFDLLTRHESTTIPYLNINAAPSNKNSRFFEVTLTQILIINKQFDLIAAYIDHPLTPPINLNAKGKLENSHQLNLAQLFIIYNQKDLLFKELMKHPNYPLDLDAKDSRHGSTNQGMTIAWCLAANHRWDILKNYADKGIAFYLFAAPLNPNHPNKGVNIMQLMIDANQIELLNLCLRNAGIDFSYRTREIKPNRLIDKPQIDKPKTKNARKKRNKKHNRENRSQREKTLEENTPSFQQLISREELLAKQMEVSLENLISFLNKLNADNKIIAAFKLASQHNREVKKGERDLVQKFAAEILKYQSQIEEKKGFIQNHQNNLQNSQKILTQLKEIKILDPIDQEYMQKLLDLHELLFSLQQNISDDIKFLNDLETKINKATDLLKKNIGNQLQGKKQQKHQQHQQNNKQECKKSKRKNIKRSPENTQRFAGQEAINKPTQVASEVISTSHDEEPEDPKIDLSNHESRIIPESNPIPLPALELMTAYRKVPSSSPSLSSRHFLSRNKEQKSSPRTKRKEIEFKNEIENRIKQLFIIISKPASEDRLHESMIKLHLLKLTEACYHLEKYGTQEEIKYLKGFRNLLCHDSYILKIEDIRDLITSFKTTLDHSNSERVKELEESENLVAINSIKALVKTITEKTDIINKIDTYLGSRKNQGKRKQTTFGDIIIPVQVKNRLKNQLEMDIQLIKSIYENNLQELVVEEGQGNALSVLHELDPDYYALCEFLIMNIYETAKRLNYHAESEVIRELRNYICHEFNILPIQQMQKFFGHDLPMIMEFLNNKKPTQQSVSVASI